MCWILPFDLVRFSFSNSLMPLKFPHQFLHISDNPQWKFKYWHHEWRQHLKNSFDHDLPSSLCQEFYFLGLSLLLCSLNQIAEKLFPCLAPFHQNSQILWWVRRFFNAKDVADPISHLLACIRVEHNLWFFYIYFMTRYFSIPL